MGDPIIIVEGKNDRKRLNLVLEEDIDIVCTFGTFGIEKFDEMLEAHDLDYRDVYIFVDSDESGEQLRDELKKELPHAKHLYVSKDTKEVEQATIDEIVQIIAPYFKVKMMFKYRK
ncbi:MAG TPA: toprim domain-containing protein [Pseudogracilibacillus sp.]|nr:toprim domain-containing protein [Pseudogracilibacillus sp.]